MMFEGSLEALNSDVDESLALVAAPPVAPLVAVPKPPAGKWFCRP